MPYPSEPWRNNDGCGRPDFGLHPLDDILQEYYRYGGPALLANSMGRAVGKTHRNDFGVGVGTMWYHVSRVCNVLEMAGKLGHKVCQTLLLAVTDIISQQEVWDLIIRLAKAHPQRFMKQSVCGICGDEDCCRPWVELELDESSDTTTILPNMLYCQPVYKDDLPKMEQDEIKEWKFWKVYDDDDGEYKNPELLQYIFVMRTTESAPGYSSCYRETHDPTAIPQMHQGVGILRNHRLLRTNSNEKGLLRPVMDRIRKLKRLYETVCPRLPLTRA
jgi:hypothetical protein